MYVSWPSSPEYNQDIIKQEYLPLCMYIYIYMYIYTQAYLHIHRVQHKNQETMTNISWKLEREINYHWLYLLEVSVLLGFPLCANGRVCWPMQETQGLGFDPCIGKISWRRKRLPSAVFLPGESHRQRSSWATFRRVAKTRTRLNMHSVSVLLTMALLWVYFHPQL